MNLSYHTLPFISKGPSQDDVERASARGPEGCTANPAATAGAKVRAVVSQVYVEYSARLWVGPSSVVFVAEQRILESFVYLRTTTYVGGAGQRAMQE